MRLPFRSRPATAPTAAPRDDTNRKRVLWLACTAHALHDGYTDMIYALLPVWQADFGLSYGALALLRAIYAGTMAALQLPAGKLSLKLGSGMTLAAGTVLAALGYGLAGVSGGLIGLCIALAISGTGSSTQHPVASGAVSRAYADMARGPLSVYNFAGDLGKSALPAAVSLLVTTMPWRHVLWLMSLLGFAVAGLLAWRFPRAARAAAHGTAKTDPETRSASTTPGPDTTATPHATPQFAPTVATGTPPRTSTGTRTTAQHRGFITLFVIGVLDTGVRMGFLTFLPFLMREKGAMGGQIGTALALVFIGGAAGKFACGWLGTRLGVIGTVLATESGTAACIAAVLFAPLPLALILLPLLGMMLNGTSSVLYGTVPELSAADRTEQAFALFYTGTIGSGAISPIVYGIAGDHIGVHGATLATAVTALAIVPLVLHLRGALKERAAS